MKNQREIKRYSTVWQAILLLTICLTTNCYSGSSGELHPQAGEGYSVVEKGDGWQAAQLVFGGVVVRIYGAWTPSLTNLEYTIENNSSEQFNIDFEQVKIEVQREEHSKTLITEIYDYSNYDTSIDDTKNAKQLYKYFANNKDGKSEPVGETKVSCAPKQKCIFGVNVVFYETKLNKDKGIKITLPATSNGVKETEVLFNCRRK